MVFSRERRFTYCALKLVLFVPAVNEDIIISQK